MSDRAIYLLIKSVASSNLQLYGCSCVLSNHFWLPSAYFNIIGACGMFTFIAFPDTWSIVTGAYFCALDDTSTNTYVMHYHDSATLVAIAHFSLVNCVKNAGHTPFTSTYFAILTNFKYKRMYDDPEHSTNIILYLKFVCSVWLYTFDRVPKAVFVCELCYQRKKWGR